MGIAGGKVACQKMRIYICGSHRRRLSRGGVRRRSSANHLLHVRCIAKASHNSIYFCCVLFRLERVSECIPYHHIGSGHRTRPLSSVSNRLPLVACSGVGVSRIHTFPAVGLGIVSPSICQFIVIRFASGDLAFGRLTISGFEIFVKSLIVDGSS